MGTPAIPIALVAGAVAGAPSTAVYKGLTVRETAGAVAEVRIFRGANNSGVLLEAVGLIAKESKSITLDDGVLSTGGLFVEIVGTVQGSVRVG
jgi:hypothetical protein